MKARVRSLIISRNNPPWSCGELGATTQGTASSLAAKRYKLSIIPSGIFNPSSVNVIATGCAVNLFKLAEEITYLQQHGFNVSNLRISNRAPLVMPYHLLIDEAQEKARINTAIGTTKRGIGPCYADTYARSAIRIADLKDASHFRELLEKIVPEKMQILKSLGSDAFIDISAIYQSTLAIFAKIETMVVDTSATVYAAIAQGKEILFEGAQGVMLDIYHGTYPFVTSSHPSASSIPIDVGIPAKMLQRILGVSKAYNTRVGSGAFPSEINGEVADLIREKGREFGTVTGRPRRIGWFDAVIMKHSARVSGFTSLAITLLDVLSFHQTIKICVSYLLDGEEIDYVPALISEYERCVPIFIELSGWAQDISQCKSVASLPPNARNYLRKIEELTGLPISVYSVGPHRDQTVVVNKSLI